MVTMLENDCIVYLLRARNQRHNAHAEFLWISCQAARTPLHIGDKVNVEQSCHLMRKYIDNGLIS